MPSARPIRILQVVTHMGPVGGGVPVWLMEVYRRIDRTRYEFDFLVHTDEPQAFDQEISELGGRILRCPSPSRIWKYPATFRQAIQNGGPYDIVHSHVLFAGHVLRNARRCGVPIRIAHSHSDKEGFRADGHFLHGAYLTWTNRWVQTDATHGLACSQRAAIALFGERWAEDPRWRILYYGIDLTPYRNVTDAKSIRDQLGIPQTAIVLGHVGRFQPQKNHHYLLRIFALLHKRNPDYRLLLVGDGPLRSELKRASESFGIEKAMIWAGVRADIPHLMQCAMDVFVLPSFYEGLPLVGIEAQAAGLPLIITDTIASEMDVTPQIHRLSASEDPCKWADAIESALAKPRIAPNLAIGSVAGRFDIDESARLVGKYYESARLGSIGR